MFRVFRVLCSFLLRSGIFPRRGQRGFDRHRREVFPDVVEREQGERTRQPRRERPAERSRVLRKVALQPRDREVRQTLLLGEHSAHAAVRGVVVLRRLEEVGARSSEQPGALWLPGDLLQIGIVDVVAEGESRDVPGGKGGADRVERNGKDARRGPEHPHGAARLLPKLTARARFARFLRRLLSPAKVGPLLAGARVFALALFPEQHVNAVVDGVYREREDARPVQVFFLLLLRGYFFRAAHP